MEYLSEKERYEEGLLSHDLAAELFQAAITLLEQDEL